MNSDIVVCKGKLLEHEEELLTELTKFISVIAKSKLIHLFHLLNYYLDKYHVYNLSPRFWIRLPIRIEKNQIISIIPTISENYWSNTWSDYIRSKKYNKCEKSFQVKIDTQSFTYLIHINYNGEFLIFNNGLRSGIRRRIEDSSTDIITFLKFNQNWNKYIPKYIDVIGEFDPYQKFKKSPPMLR